MKKNRRVITIDGLAGSGKTTLARLLAEKLGWVHFNSGLFYRGVALLTHRATVSPEDETSILCVMMTGTITLKSDKERGTLLFVDDIDRTTEVRSPEISDITSRISVHPKVRESLTSAQQSVFPDDHIVAEGRDMGTVIFPTACVKFFIEANEEVRIQRRLKQLHGDADTSSEEGKALIRQMEIEIRARDKRDSERATAPTKAASDAIIIDNSSRPLTIVVEDLYSTARKLMGA